MSLDDHFPFISLPGGGEEAGGHFVKLKGVGKVRARHRVDPCRLKSGHARSKSESDVEKLRIKKARKCSLSSTVAPNKALTPRRHETSGENPRLLNSEEDEIISCLANLFVETGEGKIGTVLSSDRLVSSQVCKKPTIDRQTAEDESKPSRDSDQSQVELPEQRCLGDPVIQIRQGNGSTSVDSEGLDSGQDECSDNLGGSNTWSTASKLKDALSTCDEAVAGHGKPPCGGKRTHHVSKEQGIDVGQGIQCGGGLLETSLTAEASPSQSPSFKHGSSLSFGKREDVPSIVEDDPNLSFSKETDAVFALGHRQGVHDVNEEQGTTSGPSRRHCQAAEAGPRGETAKTTPRAREKAGRRDAESKRTKRFFRRDAVAWERQVRSDSEDAWFTADEHVPTKSDSSDSQPPGLSSARAPEADTGGLGIGSLDEESLTACALQVLQENGVEEDDSDCQGEVTLKDVELEPQSSPPRPVAGPGGGEEPEGFTLHAEDETGDASTSAPHRVQQRWLNFDLDNHRMMRSDPTKGLYAAGGEYPEEHEDSREAGVNSEEPSPASPPGSEELRDAGKESSRGVDPPLRGGNLAVTDRSPSEATSREEDYDEEEEDADDCDCADGASCNCDCHFFLLQDSDSPDDGLVYPQGEEDEGHVAPDWTRTFRLREFCDGRLVHSLHSSSSCSDYHDTLPSRVTASATSSSSSSSATRSGSTGSTDTESYTWEETDSSDTWERDTVSIRDFLGHLDGVTSSGSDSWPSCLCCSTSTSSWPTSDDEELLCTEFYRDHVGWIPPAVENDAAWRDRQQELGESPRCREDLQETESDAGLDVEERRCQRLKTKRIKRESVEVAQVDSDSLSSSESEFSSDGSDSGLGYEADVEEDDSPAVCGSSIGQGESEVHCSGHSEASQLWASLERVQSEMTRTTSTSGHPEQSPPRATPERSTRASRCAPPERFGAQRAVFGEDGDEAKSACDGESKGRSPLAAESEINFRMSQPQECEEEEDTTLSESDIMISIDDGISKGMVLAEWKKKHVEKSESRESEEQSSILKLCDMMTGTDGSLWNFITPGQHTEAAQKDTKAGDRKIIIEEFKTGQISDDVFLKNAGEKPCNINASAGNASVLIEEASSKHRLRDVSGSDIYVQLHNEDVGDKVRETSGQPLFQSKNNRSDHAEVNPNTGNQSTSDRSRDDADEADSQDEPQRGPRDPTPGSPSGQRETTLSTVLWPEATDRVLYLNRNSNAADKDCNQEAQGQRLTQPAGFAPTQAGRGRGNRPNVGDLESHVGNTGLRAGSKLRSLCLSTAKFSPYEDKPSPSAGSTSRAQATTLRNRPHPGKEQSEAKASEGSPAAKCSWEVLETLGQSNLSDWKKWREKRLRSDSQGKPGQEHGERPTRRGQKEEGTPGQTPASVGNSTGTNRLRRLLGDRTRSLFSVRARQGTSASGDLGGATSDPARGQVHRSRSDNGRTDECGPKKAEERLEQSDGLVGERRRRLPSLTSGGRRASERASNDRPEAAERRDASRSEENEDGDEEKDEEKDEAWKRHDARKYYASTRSAAKGGGSATSLRKRSKQTGKGKRSCQKAKSLPLPPYYEQVLDRAHRYSGSALHGLAVDSVGNLYVADTDACRVYRLPSDGQGGTGPRQPFLGPEHALDRPWGLHVNLETSRLYVSQLNGLVKVFRLGKDAPPRHESPTE